MSGLLLLLLLVSGVPLIQRLSNGKQPKSNKSNRSSHICLAFKVKLIVLMRERYLTFVHSLQMLGESPVLSRRREFS